jgi:hypothetical protein
MKRLAIFFIVPLFFVLSCAGSPAPEEQAPPVPVQAAPPAPPPPPPPEPAKPAEAPYDPNSITQETRDLTRTEIEAVIKQLNTINANPNNDSNYRSWLGWLDAEYIEKVGDAGYLAALSEQPGLKSRNIALNNQQDYFIYVFAAARKNVIVDEIEFTSPQRVRVFGVNRRQLPVPQERAQHDQMLADGWVLENRRMVKTERVRYYILEKTGGQWKIANPDED